MGSSSGLGSRPIRTGRARSLTRETAGPAEALRRGVEECGRQIRTRGLGSGGEVNGSGTGWVRTGAPFKHEYPYSTREPVYNLSPPGTEGRTVAPLLFEREHVVRQSRLHTASVGRRAGAEGAGNGAEIDGFLVGRGRYGGQMLGGRWGRASLWTPASPPCTTNQEA